MIDLRHQLILLVYEDHFPCIAMPKGAHECAIICIVVMRVLDLTTILEGHLVVTTCCQICRERTRTDSEFKPSINNIITVRVLEKQM